MKTYKFESCTARLAARASLAAYEDNKEDMHIDGVTFRKIKDNGKRIESIYESLIFQDEREK